MSARGSCSTSPRAARSPRRAAGCATTGSTATRRCLRPPTRTPTSARRPPPRRPTPVGAAGPSSSTSAGAASPTSPPANNFGDTLRKLYVWCPRNSDVGSDPALHDQVAEGQRHGDPEGLLAEPLQLVVRLDALERQHHGRRAHVDLLADAVVRGGAARGVARDVADDAVIGLDGLLETAVYLRLAPMLHALVLDPLVVADRHAAGVADDVGDQLDAALGQHAVALGSGGAVGAFRHQLALEPLGHRAVDLAAQRGRDADVGVHVPEIALGDLLRLRVPAHRPPEVLRVLVDIGDEIVHVDAVGIEDGAARIVDGDQPRAQPAEDLRRVGAHVAEALQHESASRRRGPAVREPLLDGVREPLAGGLDAAFRPADARVLAGDHAAQLVPLALAVGVLTQEQPHDGAIGADVGCRDVQVGPDQRLEPVHVAQRQRLQLLAGEAARIHLDAALAAAKRNVSDGSLPGHFRRQHLEEVQRDVLVEADASFVGAARLVVLHAVRLEPLGPARHHLVEPLALEPHHAVAHGEVGADQRAPLEDEAAVEQGLQAVGQQLALGEILELVLILCERGEARVQLHRHVEDVLVVRLLQLHPYAPIEADEIGRAMEDLHRLGVDGRPAGLANGGSGSQTSSCPELAHGSVRHLRRGARSRGLSVRCQCASRHFLAKERRKGTRAWIWSCESFSRNEAILVLGTPFIRASTISSSVVDCCHLAPVKSGTLYWRPFLVWPRPSAPWQSVQCFWNASFAAAPVLTGAGEGMAAWASRARANAITEPPVQGPRPLPMSGGTRPVPGYPMAAGGSRSRASCSAPGSTPARPDRPPSRRAIPGSRSRRGWVRLRPRPSSASGTRRSRRAGTREGPTPAPDRRARATAGHGGSR